MCYLVMAIFFSESCQMSVYWPVMISTFFVVVVGGWKWRSLAIVEVVAFQMGHAVPVSRYFVLLPLAVLSENP